MLLMFALYVLKSFYAYKDSDLGGMNLFTNLRSVITEGEARGQ